MQLGYDLLETADRDGLACKPAAGMLASPGVPLR
jgi:hypothetical protein